MTWDGTSFGQALMIYFLFYLGYLYQQQQKVGVILNECRGIEDYYVAH